MSTNLDRFKSDLNNLIRLGDALHNAIQYECVPDDFKKHVRGQFKAQGSTEKETEKALVVFLNNLPDFKQAYEGWYSESLALLRQLLPDRVANFISLYEKPKARKNIEYGNYVIQDYMQSMRINLYGEERVGPSAAIPQYRQQLAILKAAQTRFSSSLFEIRQLVQADLFDSEIDAARELLKNGFVRPAGALAGVILEKHLRQVCEDHAIKITKKHPTINDLNEILRASSVIDMPQWRHISMLGDIRNLCDHNKDKEPTLGQVTDLIDGLSKIVKTIA